MEESPVLLFSVTQNSPEVEEEDDDDAMNAICVHVCVCARPGSCFLEWFTTYVHNVITGEYPIIRDQVFR